MIEAIFKYEFIQYALIIGMLIGFLAPMLGVFIVVRKMSLIADALSHLTLTGISFHLLLAQSFAVFAHIHPLWMGMGFSVAGALVLGKLRDMYTTFKEFAIPVLLSSGIGLGVVFLSLADGFNNDLFQYLFGSILLVTEEDVRIVFFVTAIVTIILIGFYKEMLFLSFDEEQAKISGMNSTFIQLLFIIITALVISISMRIVGILLVSSLMILPVATALQFARSFKQMFFYSVFFGEMAVIFGMWGAFSFHIAPGGMIVVLLLLFFIVSLTGRKLFGLPIRVYRWKKEAI